MFSTKITNEASKNLEATDKYQWIIFKRFGGTVILDETHPTQLTADKATTEGLEEGEVKRQLGEIWQKAIDSLPDRDPRFLVFNHVQMDKENPDKGFRRVLYLVVWVPGKSSWTEKSDYALSLAAFKGGLGTSFKDFKLTSKGPVKRILADHVEL